MSVVVFGHEKKLNVSLVSKKVPVAASINHDDRGCMHYKRAKGGRPAYYHYGVKVEVKYINLHFYNLTLADLGHTRVFDVDVFEKVVDGETHTYLNLYKIEMKEGEKALYKLKIGTSTGNVRIAETNSFIKFEKTNATLVDSWGRDLLDLDSAGFYDTAEENRSREMDQPVDEMIDASITTPEFKLNPSIDQLVVQLQQRCKDHNA